VSDIEVFLVTHYSLLTVLCTYTYNNKITVIFANNIKPPAIWSIWISPCIAHTAVWNATTKSMWHCMV